MINRLDEDLKNAMRSQDKVLLITIRSLKSAIKNEEISKKSSLSDEDIFSLILKEIKSRKEANTEFDNAGRTDLSDKNNAEIAVLEKYLPKMLSDEELEAVILEVFDLVNPTSMKDMGIVMKEVTSRVKGKADMGLVSNLIKDKLSKI